MPRDVSFLSSWCTSAMNRQAADAGNLISGSPCHHLLVMTTLSCRVNSQKGPLGRSCPFSVKYAGERTKVPNYFAEESPDRSLYRWIFPVAVLGSSLTISKICGHL